MTDDDQLQSELVGDSQSETFEEQVSEEDRPQIDPPGPTPVARRLRKLRESVVDIANTRERLPQPLFWSLFHSQVKDLRTRRDKDRRLRQMLYGIGDS